MYFLVVEVGKGLFLERNSSVFSRSVTKNIFDAMPFFDYELASAYAKKMKGQVVPYIIRPERDELDELIVCKAALKELLREKETRGYVEE